MYFIAATTASRVGNCTYEAKNSNIHNGFQAGHDAVEFAIIESGKTTIKKQLPNNDYHLPESIRVQILRNSLDVMGVKTNAVIGSARGYRFRWSGRRCST
jgi:hypothetical protein